MIQKVFKTAKSSVALFVSVLALSSLVLTGCGSGGGSDSYDTPETTETAPVNGAATEVLVNASTVADWIADGQVTTAASFDRKVVILDYGSYTMDPAEDPLRIKGSCRVNNGELASKRVEGVATAFPLVATGEQIDAVIQRLGIDEDTTIVFTTSGGSYFSTRAYWMFRYWGFPVENLKLLNGGNAAFAAAYPELMTSAVPDIEASEFSVRNLDGVNADLRLSIGEMLGLVSDLNTDTDLILDARGPNYYSGDDSSLGYVTGKVDLVVYDGHPEGGQYLAWSNMYEADGTFKSAAAIKALFEAKGWTKDKTTTVYCLSGYSATPLYFAVEAILGGHVRLYDGSWSQFGQYSDYTAGLGELPPGSAWASDRYLDMMGGFRYNLPYTDTVQVPLAVETLQLDTAAIAAQPTPFSGNNAANDSDVVQSQVEAADKAYATAGADSTTFANDLVAEVLIEKDQLQDWMDDGLVNAELGGQRVVILDATDATSYAKGHIPGAQLWDVAKQVQKRVEGPAPSVNLVVEGSAMDALIQEHGIDENTTIVITSSKTATYFPSRAYFLLRYWGFPKSHVKVLNGYNTAWAGTDLTQAVPTITESTLSVQNIDNIQLDTRASLAELMDAVRDNRGTAIDMRGNKAATGSTAGVYSDVAGDYGVFEGAIKNGTFYKWTQFNVDGDNGGLFFKPLATILTEMKDAGIDTTAFSNDGSYDNPAYTYCRTGYIASTGFFVLDGILGVDVMTYDGSWSQWGKMSAIETDENEDGIDDVTGAELPAGSAWATDTDTYMSVINYNATATRPQTIESLNPDANLLLLSPSDDAANQVEKADDDYQAVAPTSTDSGSAPVAGGDVVIGC